MNKSMCVSTLSSRQFYNNTDIKTKPGKNQYNDKSKSYADMMHDSRVKLQD